MGDLSHWDFAERFSGYEAAALILGVEPRDSAEEQWRVSVVLDRMKHNYQNALECAFEEEIGTPSWLMESSPKERHPENLLSIDLAAKWEASAKNGDDGDLAFWLDNRRRSGFDEQFFSRTELLRWLTAISMESIYHFDREQSKKAGQMSASVLQGDLLDTALETKERRTLLCIIAALCKEAKIPYENHAKAAGLIVSTAAKMGVSIGESTIEGHLKKIPDALATRMK